MWTYIGWALLLLVQNASFTMVSRARNSGSDWYHAVAAVFSNGVWFAATFITIDLVTDILSSGSVAHGVAIGVIYVAFTVTGSVVAGKLLRTYVEKGKRRVGHYEDQEQTTPAVKTVTPATATVAESVTTLATALGSLAIEVRKDRAVRRVIAENIENTIKRVHAIECAIQFMQAPHLDDDEDERLASYEQLSE